MADEPSLPDPTSATFTPICAIGASAGGVAALQTLFRQLPTDLGLAYVVIVHLSPDQPSALGEVLSACTRMSVNQVTDGPALKPNCVYVIAPDRELVIEGDRISSRPFSEPRGRRAPIDLFFRSIAKARGDGVAMVLSGSGADGAVGVRSIKEAGGVVMVQEPGEAEFPSMPQNAIATGAVDFVAPLSRLVERLREVAHSKDAVRSLDMDEAGNDVRRIVAFLRARTGHDFSSYKRATVVRRVTRRMQVARLDSLGAYADYLQNTPEEAKELFSDLLISVTQFFRDPRAFEALAQRAIRPILDDQAEHDGAEGIRAWVVGCATGEEAYSLAMLFLKACEQHKLQVPLQIFATDLDEGALATAREGRYPKSIEGDVSEERLQRFFVDEGSHYCVRKEVRETVLFAHHSVLKEPPFMRLDLVSCRNLLIYLERSLQQQLCSVFHYGLKEGRFLFLGSAETADTSGDEFGSLDRDARIYASRPQAVRAPPLLPQFPTPERYAPPPRPVAVAPEHVHSAASTLHAGALEQAAPPSALVDSSQVVLNLSPTAGRFILHSEGPVTNLLPAMVRPELRLDLKLALTAALEQGAITLTHPVVVAFDGERRRVAMQALPVPGRSKEGAQALVFFLDSGLVPPDEAEVAASESRPEEVRRLHAELKTAQEALVTSRSGHDTTTTHRRGALSFSGQTAMARRGRHDERGPRDAPLQAPACDGSAGCGGRILRTPGAEPARGGEPDRGAGGENAPSERERAHAAAALYPVGLGLPLHPVRRRPPPDLRCHPAWRGRRRLRSTEASGPHERRRADARGADQRRRHRRAASPRAGSRACASPGKTFRLARAQDVRQPRPPGPHERAGTVCAPAATAPRPSDRDRGGRKGQLRPAAFPGDAG